MTATLYNLTIQPGAESVPGLIYAFQEFELDEELYQVRRGQDIVQLEPKAFDVLLHLVRHRDRVVTKQELLDELWSGEFVTESVLHRAISAIRRALGDDKREARCVQTVHGRGYRFTAEVAERRDSEPAGRRPSAPRSVSDATRPSPRRVRRVVLYAVASAAALIVLLALGIFATWPAALGWGLDRLGVLAPPVAPPLPEKPSLAVLPFANLAGDPSDDYLGYGLAEDLTTLLARVPHLFVVSRRSTLAFRGAAVGVAEVGRSLGVRYVVEGSVRRGDAMIRVNAQLIDATNGYHLWGGTYDRGLGAILDLQMEIAREIAAALALPLKEGELDRVRGKSTESASAYDAFIRGVYLFERMTRADNREARRLFERATELDPDYADAWAMLGATYSVGVLEGWTLDQKGLERALQLTEHALQIEPLHPGAQMTLAAISLYRNDKRAALEAATRAVERAPYLEFAHLLYAGALAVNGRYLEAFEPIRRALRLNPAGSWLTWRTLAFLNWYAGRREKAMALLEEVQASYPELILPRLALVGFYHARGHREKARTVVQETLAVNPDLRVEDAMRLLQLDNYATPEFAAWLEAALRESGLP